MRAHIYYRDEIKVSIADGSVIAALCGHTQSVAGPPSKVKPCRRCERVLSKIRPGETALGYRPDATVRLVQRGTSTTYLWKQEGGFTTGSFIPPAA